MGTRVKKNRRIERMKVKWGSFGRIVVDCNIKKSFPKAGIFKTVQEAITHAQEKDHG